MIVIGVTGGLGSGKSSVVALLADHGAVTVDADALARAALAPGTDGFKAVVGRFGDQIVRPDGSIDRPALGRVVFGDPAARLDLEAIVHPVVARGITSRIDELAGDDGVLVLDIPLLVETDAVRRYGIEGVLVVDAPTDLAVERVVRDREISEDEARLRIAAQIDPGERLRAADFIIMNHGTLAELEAMVDGAWRWIGDLRSTSTN